MNEFTRLTE